MMRSFALFRFALLLALSALAALYGAGLSYEPRLTALHSLNRFQGVSGDKWLSDGAEMRFPSLAPLGNRLELNFDTWRPAAAGAAVMHVNVCGKAAAAFVVDKSDVPKVSLKGSCDPRVVQIDVQNPFVPSDTDTRQLGAKLNYAKVGSYLGVPIVDLILLAQLTFCIAGLVLVYHWLLAAWGAGYLAYLIAPLAFLILKHCDPLDFVQPFYLWLTFFALGSGLNLARYFRLFRNEMRSAAANLAQDSGSKLWVMTALIVTIAGAALRFYSIDFGFPNNYHPDEVPKVNAIMRMVENGDLNPRYFLHPSLLLYSTYFTNKLLHFFGMEGTFRETAFLAGRLVSATAGSLSLFLLFLIGRRMYSPVVGVLAAAMLAFFPLHVTCSRYLKEDALLLFFILGSIYVLLRAVKDDKPQLLYLAAFLAGLATSVKYSGMICIGFLAMAPWLKSKSLMPDSGFFRAAAFSALIMPLGFVLASPYTVLDSAKFLKDFGSEQHHMLRGHTTTVDAWSQLWMYHISRSIIKGTSFFSTALALLAMGVLLGRRKPIDLFLIALILMFYLPAEFVKAKPAPQPERYILPCLPFLALALAEFLRILSQQRYKALAVSLGVLAFALPLWRSAALAGEIANDTRTQMAQWMIENLPPGSKLYLDWKPYCPRFWNNEFEVTYVPRAEIIPKLDIRALKNSGQDYLVLSSLFYGRYFTEPMAEPSIRQRFREIFERVPIIKEISPQQGTYGFHNPTLTLFSLKSADFAKLESELNLKRAGQLSQTSNEMRASFSWK